MAKSKEGRLDTTRSLLLNYIQDTAIWREEQDEGKAELRRQNVERGRRKEALLS